MGTELYNSLSLGMKRNWNRGLNKGMQEVVGNEGELDYINRQNQNWECRTGMGNEGEYGTERETDEE